MATTIIVAILGSTGVATLIQFFFTRHDNRNDWRRNIEAKIDKLARDLSDDRERRKRKDADDARRHILEASDAIRTGEEHSREWWTQLHEDITDYEVYCDAHPDYKNNRARQAIEHLNAAYLEILNT